MKMRSCSRCGREPRQIQTHVGHWRVDGPQRHAEIQLPQLVEQMRQVFAGSTRATECAQRAAALVTSRFTWEKTAGRKIEGDSCAMSQTPHAQDKSLRLPVKPPAKRLRDISVLFRQAFPTPGTLLLVAPFSQPQRLRRGRARALAVTLHSVGVRLKCVSVDGEEPGIDDCDMGIAEVPEEAHTA